MIDRQNIKIAYIGGGSMNFGWQFIAELAGEEELGGTVFLYDTDKALSLANEVIGNKLREHPDNRSNFIYLATDTMEEALKDADFVILSICEGTLEELIADIHLPEMYGIYQASGESAGPGGIMRGIRVLPKYIVIAENIKKLCPEAWVINLTTPMEACIETLKKANPEIKVFGCSDDPVHTYELIADFTAREYKLPMVSRRDIKANLAGINSFAWFTEITYQGQDIMWLFRKYTELYSKTGYQRRSNEYKINPQSSWNLVKFDMFLRYGVIAATHDKNIADFCPPWYNKTPKVASSWKYGTINSNILRKNKNEHLTRAKKLMSGEEYLKIGYSKNECISEMKALLGLGNLITNADIVNVGQITNLPIGAVVQTNCLFSQNSVVPVMAGNLPDEICCLTLRHIYNQKTLVRAVFEKDLDIAFNAFLNDPHINEDIESSTELFKEMLSEIRNHLIYFAN